MNAPAIKRSHNTTHIEVSLSTHTYKLSLFKFLDDHNILKDKYKILAKPRKHYRFLILYIPIKMLSKLPFILDALNCKQINNCLSGTPSLKLVKSRAKNYYCEDFFKKLVSIFGNEKACNKFNITNMWKPRLEFIRRDYHCCPYLLLSYFNLAQYKLINYCTKYIYYSVVFRTVDHLSYEKIPCIKQYNLVSGLNTISKRRISRTLNNSSEEDIRIFKKIIKCVDDNKKFLTKDGLKLQKDLSLIRALVL